MYYSKRIYPLRRSLEALRWSALGIWIPDYFLCSSDISCGFSFVIFIKLGGSLETHVQTCVLCRTLLYRKKCRIFSIHQSLLSHKLLYDTEFSQTCILSKTLLYRSQCRIFSIHQSLLSHKLVYNGGFSNLCFPNFVWPELHCMIYFHNKIWNH